jgi:Bacterial pre-peptidase C-terminal domain
MTVYDLGTIDNNTAKFRLDEKVTSAAPNDIFKFKTLNSRSINVMSTDLQGGNADLRLYRDSNGNGTLQTGTDELIDSSTFGGTHDDQINRWRNSGTYFAYVYRTSGSPITYDFYVSATKQSSGDVTGPPNLLAKEEDLGNLTGDRSFDNRYVGFLDKKSISGNEIGDTSDIYAFTLGAGQTVSIDLVPYTYDADIRLIQDSNNSRTAGSGETVTFSNNEGSLSEHIVWNTPGTYYLQVYPYEQTNTIGYDLDFVLS